MQTTGEILSYNLLVRTRAFIQDFSLDRINRVEWLVVRACVSCPALRYYQNSIPRNFQVPFVSFDLSEERVIYSITYWVMGPFLQMMTCIVALQHIPVCAKVSQNCNYLYMADGIIACEKVFFKINFIMTEFLFCLSYVIAVT